MSIRWLAEVWENSTQDGGNLLVHLALADYSNGEGECWPTITSLAQKSRLSPRQVERALATLMESGELVKPAGRRNARNPYRLVVTRQNVGTTPMTIQPDTHVGSNPTPTSGAHVEPSGNRHEPSTLPGTDDRRQLIEEWGRIFDKKVTVSPSRLKAAERAFKEEPDLAVLIKALEGAKRYSDVHGRKYDFTDIFGTFRGTGDLASRINWFVEQGDTTQIAASVVDGVGVPSAQREMVRERQRHVVEWHKNPGDDRMRATGERAAAWLKETLGLIYVRDVRSTGGGHWEREANE